MPSLSNVQFAFHEYPASETGKSFDQYRVTAHHPGGAEIGRMSWSGKHGIHNIEVEPYYQRRGIATKMWGEGHRLAQENKIARPRHSADRTMAGDAWARSVGGRLPRRLGVD